MFFEYLHIARKVLVAHKFRSALTVLSITIGAFSIVLMMSLAASGEKTLFRSVEAIGGARVVWLENKVPERAGSKASSYVTGLKPADVDVLFKTVPHVMQRALFASLRHREIIADSGRIASVDVVAADHGLFASVKMVAQTGRVFDEVEFRRHDRTCVLGPDAAKKLFDGEVVGHTLQIGTLRCVVVGVTAPMDYFGVDLGFEWNNFVAVPFGAFADVEPEVNAQAGIQFTSDDPSHNDILKRVANAIMAERHHGVDDYQFFDFSGNLKQFTSFFAILRTIVGFIAGIALLVGGIGVMNMMLVSVSERVREIGIRKALGASPTDISRQFLFESVVLAGTGGAIGVLGGIGMALLAGRLIQHFKPSWLSVIAQDGVFFAALVSVGVGLFFGYFPARRAARLDAITAIRGG